MVNTQLPPAIRRLRGLDDGDKEQAAGQLSAALQLLEAAFLELSQGKSYFGGDGVGCCDLDMCRTDLGRG